MKKSNINVLLVALTSAVALAACNSGSPPTPTPTPSPTPTPTPAPTPTPSPNPIPMPDESGVYVFSSSALSVSYSVAPSTNRWINFTSGSTSKFVGGVSTESAAMLFSGLPSPAIAQSATVTVNYGIYATAGSQVVSLNAQLPVSVTEDGTNPADAGSAVLPGISYKQIASNGSNVLVSVPLVATVSGDNATPTNINPVNYGLYLITAAGIPTLINGYYSTSGVYTALPEMIDPPHVKFINGMYYLYGVGADYLVMYSRDGLTWQQTTLTGASISDINEIVQVSGSVYAMRVGDSVYLGNSPVSFSATPATVTPNMDSNGFLASNGNGTLYISSTGSVNDNDFNTYTPTATTLGSVVATNFTNGLSVAPRSLVFAESKIYSVGVGRQLTPVSVNGNSITQSTSASTVTSNGIMTAITTVCGNYGGVCYLTLGSDVLALNSSTNALAQAGNPGNLALISTVATTASASAPIGSATYNNLPTGLAVLIKAFAGTTNNYMMALNNGSTLRSTVNGLVSATTILNPNGVGANIVDLVSTNGSYLAVDAVAASGNNLYFSNDNGQSWITIPAADLPTTPFSARQVSIQASGGLYFITIPTSAVGPSQTFDIYQTATPQTLSTWVKVSSLPLSLQYNYWNGQYYQIPGSNSTSVGIYNTTTGQIVDYTNVLPQAATSSNVVFTGSVFALAQSNSNYLWTSNSLIDGVSAWTQNAVSFTGVGGVTLPNEGFYGSLYWTGKVWVTFANPSFNVYTASTLSNFAVDTYTNTSGVITTVNLNGGGTIDLF